MKPILFLDMDGVLNNSQMDWHEAPYKFQVPYVVDEKNLDCLEWLVEAIDCDVVICSTWRITCDRKMMEERLGPVVAPRLHDDWKTAKLPGIRGLEIRDWLERNLGEAFWTFKDYIILDDDQDFIWHQNLVSIDHGTGLTMRDCQRAVALLRAKSTTKMPDQLTPAMIGALAEISGLDALTVRKLYEEMYALLR